MATVAFGGLWLCQTVVATAREGGPMEFNAVIHVYAAGHFDRDEVLHYLRTEGYPAERAEAILMRAEGTDEFDTLRALLTSTPHGLGGLTEDEAAHVDDLTARIRLAVNED